MQGYDKDIVIGDIPSAERAHYLRRGLYRAAQRAGVSLHHKLTKNGDSFTLTFQIHDKAGARLFVLNKYGEDRQTWPYNPRRRN